MARMQSVVQSVMFGLCLTGWMAVATANGATQREVFYELPPQSLESALFAFAEKSDLKIVFAPELAKGRMSSALTGSHTPEGALQRLLSGTGLTFRYLGENSVTIVPVGERASSAATPQETAGTIQDQIKLAQVANVPSENGAEDQRRAEKAQGRGDNKTQEGDRDTGRMVEVTGSRLSRTRIEGPVPVNVYTREEISRSGQQTVVDFLNTLPEVSMGTPESGPVFSGQTTVRLRGLPLGSTLVLLNGRRLESGGGTAYFGGYFDLNSIPSAMIDRIEIVPEGSSAVYGSDALAGIVNIVLRENFGGFETNARYGAASGTDETGADLAWGHAWDRGALSVVGTWYKRHELSGLEREHTSSVAFGGYTGDTCSPGNVSSLNGGNLPGLNSPIAAVLPGAHATPALADFAAGQTNRCRIYGAAAIIPPAERSAVLVTGNYRLSPAVELFTEIMYGQASQYYGLGYRTFTSVVVPASNAFNPFGTDVRVNYQAMAPGGEYGDDNETTFFRPLIGVRGQLPGSWSWEATAWQSGSEMDWHGLGSMTDSVARTAALASSNPATALNLFTGGAPASQALLQTIFPADSKVYEGSSQVANAFVRGNLFDLPAGPLSAVFGAEYVRGELKWSSPTPGSTNFNYSRVLWSGFTELSVPLIAGRGTRAADDLLALTSAVRYDHDEYFGGHVTPQYALEWRPAAGLLVRGSYAEAFKAPGLNYVNSPVTTFGGICCVSDPRNGGAQVTYDFTYSGSPNLKPESAESRSLGVVWSPPSIPGLEASLGWWTINQDNRLTTLSSQTVVDNESFLPGAVVRNPITNQIISVRTGYFNFGGMEVSGYDMGVSYSQETTIGRLSPSLRASRTTQYDAAVAPGAPVVDRLSKATSAGWAPRWKGVASLGWQASSGVISGNVSGRYTGRYTDYQDEGPTNRQLGDFWYLDLSARYDFGRVWAKDSPWLRDAYVQVSAVNLLDLMPKYSSYTGGLYGYDATQYDIRGRFVSIALSTRF